MSAHWRLALRYAAWVTAGAALTGVVLWSLYGASHAGGFLYGVGVGVVSFVSMAATVSMLTRQSQAWIALGVASFLPRYGFVVAALGTPAYLGMWPVLAMLGGFTAVYLAENILLLPRVLGMMSKKRRAES